MQTIHQSSSDSSGINLASFSNKRPKGSCTGMRPENAGRKCLSSKRTYLLRAKSDASFQSFRPHGVFGHRFKIILRTRWLPIREPNASKSINIENDRRNYLGALSPSASGRKILKNEHTRRAPSNLLKWFNFLKTLTKLNMGLTPK